MPIHDLLQAIHTPEALATLEVWTEFLSALQEEPFHEDCSA